MANSPCELYLEVDLRYGVSVSISYLEETLGGFAQGMQPRSTAMRIAK